MNKKMSILMLLLAVILGLCYVQYIRDNDPPFKSSDLDVGVLLPLTGPVAEDGEDLLCGVRIAETYLKTLGLRKKINFHIADSKFDGRNSVNAYNKLVQEGVDVLFIAGDPPTQAVAPLFAKNKTIAIGAMLSLNVSPMSDWLFGGWFYVPETSAVMAAYMRNVLSLDEIGIFYNDTLHGIASKDSFKSTFEKLGGRIVATEAYPATATNVRSELAKLLKDSPKHIYVTGFAQGMISSFNELTQVGYTGGVFADSAASDYVVANNLKDGRNIYFIDLDFDRMVDRNQQASFLHKAYVSTTGRNHVSSQAAFAFFDIIALVTAAEYADSQDEVRENLRSLCLTNSILGEVSYRTDRKIMFPLIIKKYGEQLKKIIIDDKIWRSVIK